MSRAFTSCPVSDASTPRPSPSFDTMYEAHFDFVSRCLRRLGVASGNIEDACQEVFVVLHRRLRDFRPDSSERSFLFGIATRVASQHRRKQARTQSETFDDALSIAERGSDPLAAAVNAQVARELEIFLATLDDNQRIVFMLVEIEELSVPEVCDALGAKLNTVYSRLRLSRARFNRFVHERGVCSER